MQGACSCPLAQYVMSKRDPVNTQIPQSAAGHQGIDWRRSLACNVKEVSASQGLRCCGLQKPRPITPAGIAGPIRSGPPLLSHIDFSARYRIRCWLTCQPCEAKQVSGDLACGMAVR